jgi:prolyl oligopeptidase
VASGADADADAGAHDGGTGSPARRELVAEEPDRLERVVLVGGDTAADPAWLVCARLHHATARLAVHDARDGRHLGDVSLPEPGTVPAITGGRTDRSVHLTFETFTAPAAVLHHDLVAGATRVVTPPAASVADHLVVEQVRVHHDGVAVPLFLIHRRDVAPTGSVPTVLWGYGGFDIAVTPMFRPGWRRGSTRGACSRSRACGAGASTAGRGTTTAGAPTRSTCSTMRWPAPPG